MFRFTHVDFADPPTDPALAPAKEEEETAGGHVFRYLRAIVAWVNASLSLSQPSALTLSSLPHSTTFSIAMAPKPASTAGKAPASTASKAPAKTTTEKAAKKSTKPAASGDSDKKKRRKSRKETYSSYIYKGEFEICYELCLIALQLRCQI